MKYIFTLIIFICGCNQPRIGETKDETALIKFHDKENGVMCYSSPFRGEFSCVKLSTMQDRAAK